jgi:hypothetical protein
MIAYCNSTTNHDKNSHNLFYLLLFLCLVMSFNSNKICMLPILEHFRMLSSVMMDISLTKQSKIEKKKDETD